MAGKRRLAAREGEGSGEGGKVKKAKKEEKSSRPVPISLELLQAAEPAAALARRVGSSVAIPDRLLRQALRQASQDEVADFRSAEQKEEAIQRAAARQTPLVAVVPTGAGKSLVFIVPALLTGAGMTRRVVASPMLFPPWKFRSQPPHQRCVVESIGKGVRVGGDHHNRT